MMKQWMKRSVSVLVLGVVTMGVAGMSFAYDHNGAPCDGPIGKGPMVGHHRYMHGDGPIERAISQGIITEKQGKSLEKEMKKIHEKHWKEMRDMSPEERRAYMDRIDRNKEWNELSKETGISLDVLQQLFPMPLTMKENGPVGPRMLDKSSMPPKPHHMRMLEQCVAQGQLTQEQANAIEQAIQKVEEQRWEARQKWRSMNKEQRYMYERYQTPIQLDLEALSKETGLSVEQLQTLVPHHLCENRPIKE